jgi:hypothetical protein
VVTATGLFSFLPGGNPLLMMFAGSPTCIIQNESTSGVLVGTSGSVTLSSTQGTAYSVTSTVTRRFIVVNLATQIINSVPHIESASLAIGDTFSVKVTFPGEEYSDSFSVTSTYTNTLSTA